MFCVLLVTAPPAPALPLPLLHMAPTSACTTTSHHPHLLPFLLPHSYAPLPEIHRLMIPTSTHNSADLCNTCPSTVLSTCMLTPSDTQFLLL